MIRQRRILLALLGLLMLVAYGCSPYPYPNVSTTVVIEWDLGALTIEYQVEDSDIVAVGEIVKVDAPRWNSPDGKAWRPSEDQATAVFYTTFYIEPARLLKGTSNWGTPVAFRVMRGIAGGDVQLSVGDEVVAFGASDGRWGPDGVYQPAGAYWLTNENNSIWIAEPGLYRNQGYTKDPAESALSLEALEDRVASFLIGDTRKLQ